MSFFCEFLLSFWIIFGLLSMKTKCLWINSSMATAISISIKTTLMFRRWTCRQRKVDTTSIICTLTSCSPYKEWANQISCIKPSSNPIRLFMVAENKILGSWSPLSPCPCFLITSGFTFFERRGPNDILEPCWIPVFQYPGPDPIRFQLHLLVSCMFAETKPYLLRAFPTFSGQL
jgi:hypothetical protein